MANTKSITRARANRLLQPPSTPFLVGIEIENLRGFRRASLDLSRDLILLVGPNNAGKTSIFRLLDWVLNHASEETLRGDLPLAEHEEQLLIPARNTFGGARRLTLRVSIADRRRWSRFLVEDDVARLRLRVRNGRVFANVRKPSRSEPLESEEAAVQLLGELRESTYFRHVPATRDVSSSRFGDTLTTALEARLSERAIHQTRAGAPGEYREMKKALASLKQIAEGLSRPLWDEIQQELLPSLSRDASLVLSVDAPGLVRWMAERLELKIVTGEHDPNSVYPIEVGSGLQSLLDLAMFRAEDTPAGRDPILAIEEPEAYLHPTAQRTLARRIAADTTAKRLISTHSPMFVDEASYSNIVLVRNHVVYEPSVRLMGADRVAVNTALMTGQGAEMAFSCGVLLVEGEADKLFFETLRRRFATHDETGALDELSVVWVGSNTRFAPWMRLLESYAADGVRPIEWLVLADGIDSAAAIRRACNDARVSIPGVVSSSLAAVAGADPNDEPGLLRSIRRFNEDTRKAGFRVALLPIDLEFAALSSASDATATRIARAVGLTGRTSADLMRQLGSKRGGQGAASPLKAPWTRAEIASELDPVEISADVRHILTRWFRFGLGDTRRVNDVLRRAGVQV